MTLVTETHPDLLTAREDLAVLVNLLYRDCSLAVDDAAELSNLVREITLGRTPETLQASADAVAEGQSALALAVRLDRRLNARKPARDPAAAKLMSGAFKVLSDYAQACLDVDEALWESCLPAAGTPSPMAPSGIPNR